MFIANPGIQTQGGGKYGNHCAMLPLVTLPSISRSRIDEAELARLQDIGKLSPSVSGPTLGSSPPVPDKFSMRGSQASPLFLNRWPNFVANSCYLEPNHSETLLLRIVHLALRKACNICGKMKLMI